ncbi:dihydrolipoyl dehydrogenase [Thermoproteus tenax]|uniref:Pyruvate/2-oxoglutarate dehydrogenase complex dihydrolipoamide dehydrogenase (E3) component n=2 Tax=Thermoproteus tenax TaxID=2271 RepID=G4RN65_THETK|nr:dihydrolipoyl dehydrogenase [Thermoproteus tenax]CAF18528.1 pyruvate/2-oxoglutarate dehydrogenase complex, dihydrolipoamide E3 component and related enzymes [Thermoproteus tenax]CCC81009.1 Pyruvate/2-oxoglutarate dehydrogenase complex dihydrolipoamide dehydrogenase (E3) component [Thermoproteus tenax Kra 1]
MLGKYGVFPPTDPEFEDPPKLDKYDVIVVGGGGGGYHGAFQLSAGGYRVLMVDDKGNLGGNCLYEGCIPSKSVFYMVYLAERLRRLAKRSAGAAEVKAIWEEAVDHKDEVQYLRYLQHIREIKEHGNVDFVKGVARVLDGRRVEVTAVDGSWRKTVEGSRLLLATGSVAVRLPIPGAELAIGSEELFGYRTKRRTLPREVVVIGGGYIGVEVASAMASAGAKVTVVEMLPRIMSGWDSSIVSMIEGALKGRGVEILTNSRVTAIREESGQKVVEFQRPDGSKGTVAGEEVVMAVGRKPYVEGLEALGIVEKGRVVADSSMSTKAPGVYAAGDVLGKYMLYHAAVKESTVAAWNIMMGRPVYEVNFNAIPLTLFTEPEAAMVGISEDEARARGIPYVAVQYPLEDDSYAQIVGVREGWVKLIVERESQRIIGGSVYGEAASMIINEIALAVAVNARVRDLALLAHAHPTIFESIDRAAVRFSL